MRLSSLLMTSFCACLLSSTGPVEAQDPLAAVVAALQENVGELKAQVQALQTELQTVKNVLSTRVAFRGSLPSIPETLTPKAPIRLAVVRETGKDYNVTSGIFTAPHSGWYAVDYQLFPSQTVHGLGVYNVDLLHNGVMVARARCTDNTATTTCSSSLTQHVNAGDRLWIQTDLPDVHFFATPFDSFLSIALLFLDS